MLSEQKPRIESFPVHVPYDPALAQRLEALIARAEELADDPRYLDTDQYLNGIGPEVHAAHALRATPYAAWLSECLCLLGGICGAGHPLIEVFLFKCEPCVIAGARSGAGLLAGMRAAWMAGTLWDYPLPPSGVLRPPVPCREP